MSSIGGEDIDDTDGNADPRIDGLLSEFHWSFYARDHFSFSIANFPSDYDDTRDGLIDDYPDGNSDYVFEMPAAIVGAILRNGMEFERILPFSFQYERGHEDNTKVRYGITKFLEGEHEGVPAYAYAPDDEDAILGLDQGNWTSGDILLRDSSYGAVPAGYGSIEYMNIMHETGHALGLKHGHEPGDYDGFTRPVLPTEVDSLEFTIMTYRSFVGAPTDGGYSVRQGEYPQTLMMLDIAALQAIYGADYSTRSDDTVYAWDPATGAYSIDGALQWTPDQNVVFMTVWDGGGNDTYDFSAYASNIRADLSPGGWIDTNSTQNARLNGARGKDAEIARGNVFNALLYQDDPRALIENVRTGSGSDKLYGNEIANTLDAGNGDDVLFGNKGDDILIGGRGRDELHGGAGLDLAGYTAAGGVDVTVTQLGGLSRGRWRVDGVGEGKGDQLDGIEGFLFGKGNDTVRVAGLASVNIYGGKGDDTLIGGAGTAVLIGEQGSDTLRPGDGLFSVYGGFIGADGDWVEGGKQFDTLKLDRAHLGSDYTLSWGPLFGTGELGAFSGTGGSLARGITSVDYTGGSGNDTVDGGIGRDVITGGGGNDLLRSGDGKDDVSGGDGNDTIQLGEGDDLAFGGAGDDYIYGNGGNDKIQGGEGRDNIFGGEGDDEIHSGPGGDLGIYGEAGNDTLYGDKENEVLYGGADNDTLIGGEGDDSLSGESGSDIFVFAPDSGHDIVYDFDSKAKGGQDQIDVRAFGFASFRQMLDSGVDISQSGGTTTILFGADGAQVDLYDVAAGSLDGRDFIFF